MFLNIITDITSFFESHKQVNKFGFGESSNISTKENLFPMVWLQPTDSPIKESEIDFKFDLYCFTLAEQDKENLKDSLNDTQQILIDFISYFKINQSEDYWLDTENLTITPFNGSFDDFTNGWQLNFNFKTAYDYSSCTLPLNDLAIFVEQLDTSIVYTYYDIEVTATGGVAPYTGTGTFSKQYGTYTFTVTDADGDSVSEDFTVQAPEVVEGNVVQYATGNITDDDYHLEPFGFYLATGTYYVNWGDRTDSIVVATSNNYVHLFDNHIYATEGVKHIDFLQLDAGVEIPIETLAVYGQMFNFNFFKLHKADYLVIGPKALIFGDIVSLKITKDDALSRTPTINISNYQSNTSYPYGDIVNLKYWTADQFRFAGGSGIYGDIAELMNQDWSGISYNFHSIAFFTISNLDPGYTENKNIKSFRIYSAVFNDEETTNFLLQVSQNQTYSGGVLTLDGNAPGKLDLTDPDTLAAYNNLIGLGWAITIPTY